MVELSEFARIQRASVRLLNHLLDCRLIEGQSPTDSQARDLAVIAAEQFSGLRAIAKGLDTSVLDQQRIELHAYNPTEYLCEDLGYRRNIAAAISFLNDSLLEFVEVAIIHGSQADRQYEHGWSDLDTIIFLKRETVESAYDLLALRQRLTGSWDLLTAICAYQHHPFLFVPDSTCFFYDTAILPIEALTGAIAQGDKPISLKFHSVRSSGGSLASMKSRLHYGQESLRTRTYGHHGRDGVFLNIDFKNANDNMYQLFAYLNYLMLVPSLMLDARGTPCYKGQSFVQTRDMFDDRSRHHLRVVGEIRTNWGKRCGTDKRDNSIPEWVIETLGPRFFENGVHLLSDAIILSEGS